MSKRLRLPTARGLPPWTPFQPGTPFVPTPEAIAKTAREFGISIEAARQSCLELAKDEIWLNSRYQVNIRRDPDVAEGWPAMIWLSIKRLDKDRVGRERYRDFLRIKTELVGPEHEAVELYPAEARDVDTANQYHLWVLADPKLRFPFGFTAGKRVGESTGNARQHPFSEGERR